MPCSDGGPGTVRLDRRAIGVVLGAACLLAVACGQESPRRAALGDDIEIGPYAFAVVRAGDAPDPSPPLNTFRTQPGRKAIVVSVHWKTLDAGMDGSGRLWFSESFFTNQLSIADSEGKRIEVSGVLPEGLIHMQDLRPNWRDWGVVFYVPKASRGLTLLVENPEPRAGQAHLTAVPLGM